MSGILTKQVTASGLITGKRATFRQLLVFSTVANDAVIEFYDRTTAPTGGETHYEMHVYGKGVTNIPFVGDGVLFDDGIYIVVPIAGITVTVLYEEV